ncbi:MAG: hypothetical protein E7576_05100 [Ruminococcaceae bacterium]|jgi:hypothetical protein|nr:hypothetical protein [Oscillospiraceae bacterium]
MKRLTAIFLLLALLLGTAAGCSEKPADENGTTGSATADTPAADQQTEPEPEEETVLTDGLPESDMQGFELNILHHSQEWLAWAYNVLEADELTGEALNDAIYARTDAVQNRFNAKIVTETMREVNPDVIAQLAVSGDSSYDLALMYDLRITGAIQYLADMNDLPYISLDQAWWNPYASSIFTIGGKQYASSGNFSLSVLSRAGGYAFNADMMNALNLGSPYEHVKNGTWTVDVMMQMADAANQDINGDSQQTNDDQFGIESSVKEHFLRMIFGSGVALITKDEAGYPVFSLSTDDVAITKMQHILDVSSHGGWYNTTSQNVDSSDSMVAGTFQNGRALFVVSNPNSLSNMRDYDFNFGFVPVPKYDETQTVYYAPSFGAELSVLPMSYDTASAEQIGTLLEAMALYSQQNIVPEYIETLVKTKYARDAESAEMLAMAFDGIYFDFGINAWQEQVAAKLLKGSFVGLAGNFGSVLQTMQKSVDSEIKRLIKQIDKAG